MVPTRIYTHEHGLSDQNFISLRKKKRSSRMISPCANETIVYLVTDVFKQTICFISSFVHELELYEYVHLQ